MQVKSPVFNEPATILLDCSMIRQRALEKARLKSDEELGLKIPQHIKRLMSPPASTHPSRLSDECVRKLKIIGNNSRIDNAKPRNAIMLAREFESKTETDSEASDRDDSSERRLSRTQPQVDDDLYVDGLELKKMILDDFDKNIGTNKSFGKFENLSL